MTSAFLAIVSSFCIWAPSNSYWAKYGTQMEMLEYKINHKIDWAMCFQTVEFSTSLVQTKDGETIYKAYKVNSFSDFTSTSDAVYRDYTESDSRERRSNPYALGFSTFSKDDAESNKNIQNNIKMFSNSNGFNEILEEKCPICGYNMMRHVGQCTVFHLPGSRCDYNDPFCPNKINHKKEKSYKPASDHVEWFICGGGGDTPPEPWFSFLCSDKTLGFRDDGTVIWRKP